MPRPRSLATHQLIAATLAVTDRSGLPGLTMRTVAAELGMSTMALYRYVADREELERLVVDHVFATMDLEPPPPGLPWHDRVEIMMERVRGSFREHPAVVALTLVHRHQSPAVLRWAESLLGILTDAGFADRSRAVAVRALFSYLIGAIQLEHLGSLSGPGTLALAELPPEAFPHTADNAQRARQLSDDEEFTGGLALLLAGLDDELARRGPGRPDR